MRKKLAGRSGQAISKKTPQKNAIFNVVALAQQAEVFGLSRDVGRTP
jgi:hypothetical protein